MHWISVAAGADGCIDIVIGVTDADIVIGFAANDANIVVMTAVRNIAIYLHDRQGYLRSRGLVNRGDQSFVAGTNDFVCHCVC